MPTRRTFLRGLMAGAAALVLPPSLKENAEATRRFWSLDSTMLKPEMSVVTFDIRQSYDYRSAFADWVESYERPP